MVTSSRRTASRPAPRPQAPARILQNLQPYVEPMEFTLVCGGEPTNRPTLADLVERKAEMDEAAEAERQEAEKREREEKAAKKKEAEEDDLKKIERFRNDRYAVKLLRNDEGVWGSRGDEMDALG
jgi:hypothetical protein